MTECFEDEERDIITPSHFVKSRALITRFQTVRRECVCVGGGGGGGGGGKNNKTNRERQRGKRERASRSNEPLLRRSLGGRLNRLTGSM